MTHLPAFQWEPLRHFGSGDFRAYADDMRRAQPARPIKRFRLGLQRVAEKAYAAKERA